jgi:hypothetical protein
VRQPQRAADLAVEFHAVYLRSARQTDLLTQGPNGDIYQLVYSTGQLTQIAPTGA